MRSVLGLFALVLLSVIAGLMATFSEPRPSSTVSAGSQADKGLYYRLKVDLTYRGTPVAFDIVVGCNVRIGRVGDGSTSYEVGLVPTVFGKRMEDGKGLVVRPPSACHGETTDNGKVAGDLLPIVVVYDDAATLAFGTAYMSEDAYENPLSVLTFQGARIEAATRPEFDAFRREQTNLVTPEMYHTIVSQYTLDTRGLKATDVRMGLYCNGYARFRLVGQSRQAAMANWPPSHPTYWIYQNRPGGSTSLADLRLEGGPDRAHGSRYTQGTGEPAADSGLPTRAGGGRVGARGSMPAEIYPNVGPWLSLPWPLDPREAARKIIMSSPYVDGSMDLRNGLTRGFAYCWSTPLGRLDNLSGERGSYMRRWQPPRIDGEPIFLTTDVAGRPTLIYERGDYLLKPFAVGLASVRGDV